MSETMSTITWCLLLMLTCLSHHIQLTSAALQVTVDPEQATRYEQSAVTFNCYATGTLFPIRYMWTFDNDPEWNHDQQNLTILSVDLRHDGVYTCHVVTNEAVPQNQSDSAVLVVYHVPKWNLPAVTKFAGSIGEEVSMVCQLLSNPAPKFYWQFPEDTNITSTPSRQIVDQDVTSTVRFTALAQQDYGEYYCHAYNEVGRNYFKLQMQEPGIPDSPVTCEVHNTTSHGVLLMCVPGFSGGESCWYPVLQNRLDENPSVASASHEEISPYQILIKVDGLEGNTSYSLRIYSENVHGRSSGSVNVFTRTAESVDEDSGGMSTDLIIIICGVAGGVLLVVILVIIICCCIKRCRRTPKGAPRFENTKDTQSYVMEEGASNNENFTRGRQDRSSWASFRRKRPAVSMQPGIENRAYTGAIPPGSPNLRTPATVADYSGGANNTDSYINLNYNPGESTVGGPGVDNTAYSRDTSMSELNLSAGSHGSTQYPGSQPVEMRRGRGDAASRARAMSREQPSLAGLGALQTLAQPGTTSVIVPLTPKLRNDRRISGSLEAQPSASGFFPAVPWEFKRELLYIRRKLGEGSFGEVWRATVDGILNRKGKQVVAVKMLKDHHTPDERKALQKELEVMKLLQPHPNIVQLLGCCTDTEPLCIIMEYAPNGNLQDLLRKQRSAFQMNNLNIGGHNDERHANLTARDLSIFALHIASGMDYIASKELLHRDLATRNVLVDNEMVCKVCDFGSARDMAEMRQYESRTQRRLPIRWMSPESLYQCEYSVKSDVWAFGVVLWEILTLGASPYPGMAGPDVMEFVQKGCRMEKPRHCSDTMYAIMKDCWAQFPMRRPAFSLLRHRLMAVLDEPDHIRYVDQMGENALAIMPPQPGEKC